MLKQNPFDKTQKQKNNNKKSQQQQKKRQNQQWSLSICHIKGDLKISQNRMIQV